MTTHGLVGKLFQVPLSGVKGPCYILPVEADADVAQAVLGDTIVTAAPFRDYGKLRLHRFRHRLEASLGVGAKRGSVGDERTAVDAAVAPLDEAFRLEVFQRLGEYGAGVTLSCGRGELESFYEVQQDVFGDRRVDHREQLEQATLFVRAGCEGIEKFLLGRGVVPHGGTSFSGLQNCSQPLSHLGRGAGVGRDGKSSRGSASPSRHRRRCGGRARRARCAARPRCVPCLDRPQGVPLPRRRVPGIPPAVLPQS